MTVNSTPTERSMAARVAAYTLHATHDSRELTVKAREAFFAKFVDEVDPDRKLPEDERIRRADAARQAHMQRLALRSVQSRRRNKEARSTAATKASTGAVVGPVGSTVRPLSELAASMPAPTSNAAREHGVAPADPSSESDEPAGANRRAV